MNVSSQSILSQCLWKFPLVVFFYDFGTMWAVCPSQIRQIQAVNQLAYNLSILIIIFIIVMLDFQTRLSSIIVGLDRIIL